ncbi:isoleucine--tRNA ligase [Bacteroidota bacterium]
MKYREYKNLDFAKVGEEIRKFWEENDVFEKSVINRSGSPEFSFYEGPPSANGTPGIHHVMARSVKDIFCRFKTMEGYQVKRKGGWDTHGLPVELKVEKELGITKEDIGKKISIVDYNQKCRLAVMKYKDQWDNLTCKMGYWIDLDNPYITFERDYMETVWWLLKKFYERGLLYKGYSIQPYSPAAGSGLSSHELNQPGTYKDVKDTSITAQFRIKGTENEYLLAWTTTPWTLPGNSALAVGKKIDYVKVQTFNPYTYDPITVILAKDRFPVYFNEKDKDLSVEEYRPGDKKIPHKVIGEMKGNDLVGLKYEQLLPYVPLPDPAFTIISADFITTEDGTGVVHISPTFGADDLKAANKNGIPAVLVKDENGDDVPIVDKQGRFTKEITDFAGMYVKNYDDQDEDDPDYRPTDVLIAIKLKGENKAFRVERYVHSYPHCWRTDKPVLYYPLSSWFIKTTAFKDRLVELNNTINWKPESTGIGRFGNWLENLVDWNLSRSRFWGTPLPIWATEDKKEEICIGSIQELREEVDKAIAAGIDQKPIGDDIDLHRPFVDEIVLLSKNGNKMYREPDLIDVWFDAGSMPYAQLHYPFEDEEIFKRAFPADFIAEGVDQTRGWFFTLHAIAGMIFDSVAFKNVVSNGLVLDKNGNKMSKRLGNTVDPFKTIEQYGPDALRWYMISNADPWDNLKFDLEGIAEVQRRFFGTLTNTYSFFALYANLDGFRYEEGNIPLDKRTESDQWILSRLNSSIKAVQEAYDDYEPTRAARTIQNFVIDDLSNWYVRLNRKRFWKGSYNEDKMSAYQTLYTCLVTVARLTAPIAPFYTENLFRDLNAVTNLENNLSIHLTDFPKVEEGVINGDLEEKMGLAQSISSLVHSLRKKHKIKVRQPLSRILIPILNQHTKDQITSVEDIILTEVNVKTIEYIDDTSGVLVKKIKPNFKKLGQEYGKLMKEITQAVNGFSQEDITTLEKNDQIELALLSGETISLTSEDVEISSEDIPGWSVASEGDITLALDITLTESLRQEGLARDLVNRIQNTRKDMGLDVQDKINISVEKNGELLINSIENFKEYICTETQALKLELKDIVTDGNEFDIDGLTVKLKIEV